MSTEDGEEKLASVQEAHNRIDSFVKIVGRLEDEVEALREENQELREELGVVESRIGENVESIHDLRQRTDLLDLVEAADNADGRQRSVALLQHCKRKIDRDPSASRVVLDRDDADAALHHPDVDRSTIYRDMERAADLVGNRDVVRYSDGELQVELGDGTLGAVIGEHGSGGGVDL